MVQKTSGDFPLVLYDVVSKRSSVIEGSLSITDINNILDELSNNIGKSCVFSYTVVTSLSSCVQRRAVENYSEGIQPLDP